MDVCMQSCCDYNVHGRIQGGRQRGQLPQEGLEGIKVIGFGETLTFRAFDLEKFKKFRLVRIVTQSILAKMIFLT